VARNLDLALIGNGTVSALIDGRGEMVWACLPRADGDPVFCSLLREHAGAADFGFFAVELADFAHAEQQYVPNTALLSTLLFDKKGGCVEIVDAAPRFRQFGRMFCPMTLVRRVSRVSGSPRVTVKLLPAKGYGAEPAATTFGSNHVRYLCGDFVLRVTTDCSISALLEGLPFVLHGPLAFVLGPDETLQGSVADVVRHFVEATEDYWRDWVRDLSIPFEYQDAVIRAAITLKLSAIDDTGAIVAAMTTSLPEDSTGGRTWDYRYCWLRDAYFTVDALNRLNATRTMERLLGYIVNVAAASNDGSLQPVYRIDGRPDMEERTVASLPGYRGIGPVRIGNAAHRQVQNDVYGSAVLAATHLFFDRRLLISGSEALFQQLEVLGNRAAAQWSVPEAGIWELRSEKRVHTFSSGMCWVACDRLAKIAAQLGLSERKRHWRGLADQIRRVVSERAWNAQRRSFVSTLDGDGVDASLLLLAELGFLRVDDPRFASTVEVIEGELRRGDFVFRYSEPDDFGSPRNAFLVCTCWYIDALARLGRREEARALFENLLSCRNRHGLLSEHIDPVSRELWGNFPQTFSMVGLINSATRLSISWEEAF
jgi:GH15 family glucan-1,4-alpha-glucosidase